MNSTFGAIHNFYFLAQKRSVIMSQASIIETVSILNALQRINMDLTEFQIKKLTDRDAIGIRFSSSKEFSVFDKDEEESIDHELSVEVEIHVSWTKVENCIKYDSTLISFTSIERKLKNGVVLNNNYYQSVSTNRKLNKIKKLVRFLSIHKWACRFDDEKYTSLFDKISSMLP